MTYFRSISATMTFCALLLLATLLGTLVFRRVLRKRRAGIEALSKFRGCLAHTQTCVDQYLRRAPHWHLAEQIVAQLLALEHWTRDGCYPTGRQRARINLGLLAVREIEPTDDTQLYKVAQGFHELQSALNKLPCNRVPQRVQLLFKRHR